ncbi:MAG: REP-associated tyrosine transposase [Methylococcales bacterium]
MVILPDHLHALWTLPVSDCNYPTRWMLIKAGFSRRMPNDERVNKSRMTKGERGLWQRRYWEHLIRDERDYVRHVDYRLHPLQSGEAWVCRAGDGLATFNFSPICRFWDVSERLGGYERSVRRKRLW